MTGCRNEFVPQEHKTSVIQINSYENKNFVGSLQNPYYDEQKAFTNLTQLLFLIENLQDDLQYPQKSMEMRSFRSEPIEPLKMQELEVSSAKPLATFKVSILFRRNASWQGTVSWVDENLGAQFRSVLELITLMDSVLD